MIIYPQVSVNAAREGLQLWLQIALPALFPFMVVTEIFILCQLPQLLSVFFAPLMGPLFRLPGSAGLALLVGFTTGFPIGAILTARLVQEGALTVAEGERLALFTNNASPLFILGAVATGLLGDPRLGVMLAISHYLANLLVGLWYCRRWPPSPSHPSPKQKIDQRLFAHWRWWRARASTGPILGPAITNAMNNMLKIGGYLIFFTVFYRLLNTSSLVEQVTVWIGWGLEKISLSSNLAPGMIAGFLEMTIGCQLIAISDAPLADRLLVLTVLMAWGGLSIFAQVSAFLTPVGISIRRYLPARLLQSTLAVILMQLQLPWLSINVTASTASASYPSAMTYLTNTGLAWITGCYLALGIILLVYPLLRRQY